MTLSRSDIFLAGVSFGSPVEKDNPPSMCLPTLVGTRESSHANGTSFSSAFTLSTGKKQVLPRSLLVTS